MIFLISEIDARYVHRKAEMKKLALQWVTVYVTNGYILL